MISSDRKINNTYQSKAIMLRLKKSLYLEMVNICKRNGYRNVQEFIREAIRKKIKEGGI